jgi:murein DD-endopeptidase MepM/ murein hydrolase activator NlpD
MTMTSRLAVHAPAVGLLAILTLGACEVISKDSAKKQDTTVAPAGPAPANAGVGADSVGGVPAVPSDSAARAAGSADTGIVQLYPSSARRGGVLFAYAQGLAMQNPHCSWKGAPLPCYTVNGGVLATVPLPADEPAGTFTLTIDRPSGRLTRQIVVNDRDFGREVVFLQKDKYALITQNREIARDARAMHAILSGESADRRWSGRWKEALPGGKSSGYGIDRFYYQASDSSRAISLGPSEKTRGTFGGDTSDARPNGAPGWRHAGIDIPAKQGTAIVAPAAGQVAEVGDYTLSGHTLVIDHGQGVYSAYFHLDTSFVRKGDLVRQGKTLGRVGMSGLTTGPHLHFGVYLHGRDVDPAAWRDMPPFARGDSATTTASR